MTRIKKRQCSILHIQPPAESNTGSALPNCIRGSAMSLIAWYLHKADQSARLANDARDPQERAKFESERSRWVELAFRQIVLEAGEPRKPRRAKPQPINGSDVWVNPTLPSSHRQEA